MFHIKGCLSPLSLVSVPRHHVFAPAFLFMVPPRLTVEHLAEGAVIVNSECCCLFALSHGRWMLFSPTAALLAASQG